MDHSQECKRISDTKLKHFKEASAPLQTGHLWEKKMKHGSRIKQQSKKKTWKLSLCLIVCVSLWQIISRGSMDAALMHQQQPHKQCITITHLHARHSKWSTHNWTPLLNGSENNPALHCKYKRMGDKETDERRRRRERQKHRKSQKGTVKSEQVNYRSRDGCVFHSGVA